MNIPNYKILNASVGDPAGYVTKDCMWAAVPHGNGFIIIHNGKQVHRSNSLSTAKSYINKQVKLSKSKAGGSTILNHFSK